MHSLEGQEARRGVRKRLPSVAVVDRSGSAEGATSSTKIKSEKKKKSKFVCIPPCEYLSVRMCACVYVYVLGIYIGKQANRSVGRYI